jgi:hypothetical protein
VSSPLRASLGQSLSWLPGEWPRALGARIGSGSWCESYWLPEADLVILGPNSTVNRGCEVQTHLFRDRVMSIDTVTLDAGATMALTASSCRRPGSGPAAPSDLPPWSCGARPSPQAATGSATPSAPGPTAHGPRPKRPTGPATVPTTLAAITDSGEPGPTAACTPHIATARSLPVHVMCTAAARSLTTHVSCAGYSVGI